jgi:hypothetical protein
MAFQNPSLLGNQAGRTQFHTKEADSPFFFTSDKGVAL